jgi:hypothetical protein
MNVCVITLDIAKAFDTVNHKLLLLNLLMIGFDELSFAWFKSYLSNRAQFVVYNRKMCSLLPLNMCFCGTSIRASTLFCLYKWYHWSPTQG